MTPALKLPSASVVTVLVRPSREVTMTSAPGMTAPEISTTVPTVLPAAGCCAGTAACLAEASAPRRTDAGPAIASANATTKKRPDCRIIKVDSTTDHSMAEPDRYLLEGPHSRVQELLLLL